MKKLFVALILLFAFTGHLNAQSQNISYFILNGSFDVIHDGVLQSGKDVKTLELSDSIRFYSPLPGLCVRKYVNGVKEGSDILLNDYEGTFRFQDLLEDEKGLLKYRRTAAYKEGEDLTSYFNAIRYILESSERNEKYVPLKSISVCKEGSHLFIKNRSSQSFFLDVVCVINQILLSAISQDKNYSSNLYFWPDSVYEIELSDFLAEEDLYIVVSDKTLPVNGISLSQQALPAGDRSNNLSLIALKETDSIP